MSQAASQVQNFIAELDASNQVALDRLGKASTAGEASEDLTVPKLLQLALKNELEATDIAAYWMIDTAELDVRLALARQVGDEAKHYRLIEVRLRAMGINTDTINPLANGYSPLFSYLKGLTTTVERIAAGQFTRESIAIIRNRLFADYCESRGDVETAALYKEIIQPDEEHHHNLGRKLLLKYATTAETQELARNAAARTLQLAEEIQEMVRLKAGISRAPGC
ncbi:MAG TPA: ferritin-like domain-containing protein [Blastocatellia bacterium]|nr:ferritin-like domain-containing protein [Blastocatellia bacterium]